MEENEKHVCCGKHNHDKGEGCGCGHSHSHNENEPQYISLKLEDGKDHKCIILATFDVPTIPNTEYIALLPEGTDEVILFSFSVDGDALDLIPVSEDTFEEVSSEFMTLYGEENFN